jgi:hypothetical protein
LRQIVSYLGNCGERLAGAEFASDEVDGHVRNRT